MFKAETSDVLNDLIQAAIKMNELFPCSVNKFWQHISRVVKEQSKIINTRISSYVFDSFIMSFESNHESLSTMFGDIDFWHLFPEELSHAVTNSIEGGNLKVDDIMSNCIDFTLASMIMMDNCISCINLLLKLKKGNALRHLLFSFITSKSDDVKNAILSSITRYYKENIDPYILSIFTESVLLPSIIDASDDLICSYLEFSLEVIGNINILMSFISVRHLFSRKVWEKLRSHKKFLPLLTTQILSSLTISLVKGVDKTKECLEETATKTKDFATKSTIS